MTGAFAVAGIAHDTCNPVPASSLASVSPYDEPELVSLDLETTSLDPMGNEIVGLSFCVEPGRACYVPLAHRYAGAPEQLGRPEAGERVLRHAVARAQADEQADQVQVVHGR